MALLDRFGRTGAELVTNSLPLPWSAVLIKTKWKFYENNVDNIPSKIRILTKSKSSPLVVRRKDPVMEKE